MQETSRYDSHIAFYKENYNYFWQSQTKINNDTHGEKQHNLQQLIRPGARLSKAPKTFRARKAIFSSSVSKNGEVYTPETSCVKRTSLHIKNM